MIVAFLQNQWFKNPVSARRVYEKHGSTPEGRARLTGSYLFMGCTTGNRLQRAFGNELCDQIIWENASPEIGGVASSKFKPDPEHIAQVIGHWKPQIVVALGRHATDGVTAAMRQLSNTSFKLLSGPHPAARHATVMQELECLRNEIGNVTTVLKGSSDA